MPDKALACRRESYLKNAYLRIFQEKAMVWIVCDIGWLGALP